MNNDRRQLPFSVVPRDAALAVVRAANEEVFARRERAASAQQGQQAGVPGLGEPPRLVHDPGGAVVRDLLHPAFTVYEALERVLPEQGWFDPDLDPSRPVKFQIAAFTVPRGQALLLFDYQFTVYRPSGIDPGDAIPAAPGRFSNQLGFDLNISGKREASLTYQLEPRAATLESPAFAPPAGDFRSPGQFNAAAAGSFASTASEGTSLLPVRPEVQGPRDMPWALVVGEGGIVAQSCVIFRTLLSPVSWIEARQAGYLVGANTAYSLLNRVRPR